MEQAETRQALFETGQSVKHQNRHLREVYLVVGRGKNGNGYLLLGDEPVRTPYLQATDGSGFERAEGSAFRAGLVYENTDAAKAYRLFQQNAKPYRNEYDLISEADFYRAFGKIEPERQRDVSENGQAEPSIGKEAALPPEERLQLAKHRYLMQGTTLTASEKQMRAVLEHAMENLIHGLPPQVQMQARTNFYESQIQQQAQKYDMGADLHNDYSPER